MDVDSNRRIDWTETRTNNYTEDGNKEYDTYDERNQGRKGRINLRNTSAVTMFCGGNIGYAEALTTAKENINLQNLDIINNMNIRRSMTGGLIFEIHGQDQKYKADKLAEELKQVFRDKEVHINRPTPKTEFIISGLDDSITEQDVEEALVRLSGWDSESGKMGRIKKARDGMGSIWIQCPSTTAVRICTGNKIRIGWTWASTEILRKRPLKCFKCLANGHVRMNCDSKVDRRGSCFNCGEMGHKIGDCRNRSYCPACYENGLSYTHRTGSNTCKLGTMKCGI
ncbi:Gag-Pol polyprotein [Trachymyrmex zeteki]|uniref:Gag-Pol polyprotein n=1 Tax=Mycetomoellerius zeteki TaxID=64791 RepID=A0A151WUG6_9HYME|nr:Gag-Pol polyprotein [Trachymyrmex zeteki]